MKKTAATLPATGSVISDLMEEPRKKRPAGGRNPGEPKSKRFSRQKKYAPLQDVAMAAPIARAERQMSYWEGFRRARNSDHQASAWIVAIVCDYALPKNAGRLSEAMQPYRDPQTGEIDVGHEALAVQIGAKDAKTIRTTIHAMHGAGYLRYVPGRKGVGFSKFVMTVPDVSDVNDVVSREKIPGCDGKSQSPKATRPKQSAGKKSPADQRLSREKIPGDISNKSISESGSDHSALTSEGVAPLKGSNLPSNTGYEFRERPCNKLAERRNAPKARSAPGRTAGASPVCSTPAEIAAIRDDIVCAQIQLSTLEVQADDAYGGDRIALFDNAIREAEQMLAYHQRRLKEAMS